jgi:hypothetical protein
MFDEEIVKSLAYDEAMVASAAAGALEFCAENDLDVTLYTFDEEIGKYQDNKGNEPVVASLLASAVESSGARFIIPLAVPTELASGDERSFEKNSITSRNLPLPLMWQIKTSSGHDGSVVVGRIDSIEIFDDGSVGNVRGVFDVGPFGREAERMVRGRFLRGVSVDLDKFEAQVEPEDFEKQEFDTKEEAEKAAKDVKNSIKNDKILVKSARLMGITIVPKPAFQECFIMIEEEPTLELEEAPIDDGIFEEIPEDYEHQLAAIAASAAPMVPPKAWFKDPGLDGPTPLTITDEGQVFGHIAAWQTSHIGMPGRGVKPPRSASQYAYFRNGVLRTDEGDVQVGQLTLAGGHASLQASADEAIKHYDDTASAVADVVAGEDQFGIWVAGSLRPEVTPSQIRAFRASSPSGDWRPINGRLELVAVCQVNVPGFPIARAITASGGVPGALVAAGAAYLAELRENNKIEALERRLNSLEKTSLSADVDAARGRMSAVLAARNAELSAKADAARARMNSKKASEEAELSAKVAQLRAKFNSR